ncbi:restriction endonuclease subunit S [Shewanella sp. SM34]|uniref:restriction endonuclease subunit S n=1 Tax=unclassified Shewanella TaxID=196818 RepID=UPI0021D81CD5|nr:MULTISPECIES: restriction endonuclease subunit S [unclassified Shewanella]MCU8056057.1 restriction endonuclease subunit S [Shewanella sp. SM35]MCU8064991.1 restriction endonuclease subunit S [Shewanella sp. SM34]
MSEMIPESWARTILGDVISISSGQGLTKSKMIEGEIPVFGGNGVTGWHNDSNIEKETIAIGRVGYYCGSVHLTPKRAWITDNAFITSFDEKVISQKFLYLLLTNADLRQNDSSTAQPVISGAKVYPIEINLPPLAEQKVIADKLDELLALVESTKAHLDAIPAILKSFRQSVLAAAVSGELVTEKPKYLKYYLSDISEKITDGEHITPKTLSHGIPLLSAKDVQENELLFENVKYVSRAVADKAISRCNPEFGDILIVSRGATVGRTHLVKIDDEFCLMGSVLLIKLNKNIVMSEYMELVFKDSRGQKQLIATSGSSAQQAIYIRDVKSFKLELPSKSIQKEIVRRVEELFGFADKVEAQVNAAQARVNNLTQAILAKAFRGELTADWRAANPELISGENSAEALLEKIKFERQFMLGKKTRKKA